MDCSLPRLFCPWDYPGKNTGVGCYFLLQGIFLTQESNMLKIKTLVKLLSEVAQSCPTLCDPMDYSLPGSSIYGIFQARLLVWVAISFSRRSSRPRDWTRVSHIVGRCFTVWATREVMWYSQCSLHVSIVSFVAATLHTYVCPLTPLNCPFPWAHAVLSHSGASAYPLLFLPRAHSPSLSICP